METNTAQDPWDFAGKVVLVTGGGRGLGRSIAHLFAKHGASVAVTAAVHPEEAAEVAQELRRAHGVQCISLAGDVSTVSDVIRITSATEESLGPIDILINNAGIIRRVAVLDMSLDDWERQIDVNLTGPFLMSKAVAPSMKQRGGGSIVNIASIVAYHAFPERSAYCASKAGLVSLTKCLALEWAPLGINVNAIAPGYLDTPATRPLFVEDNPYYKWILSRTPKRKVIHPDDVAWAALYLCSPAAQMVTGVVLPVDGGWTAA